jgi:hypothetical protein
MMFIIASLAIALTASDTCYESGGAGARSDMFGMEHNWVAVGPES